MWSKMLAGLCAMTTAAIGRSMEKLPPLWELKINHDKKGVGIYVDLPIGEDFETGQINYYKTQIDTGSCNIVYPHAGCEECVSDHKYSTLKSAFGLQKTG